MNHGSFPLARFSASDTDESPGAFEAVVSTFGTRVKGLFYDQMLRQGCFERTLRERGLPAVVWSHDWDTPPIGLTHTASETAEGLHVNGRLFVDEGDESPMARQVHTAMRATGGDGRHVLREFSIGFDIVEAEWEVHEEEEVLVITDVHLYEYGPCLLGRNVSRLLQVASDSGARPPATPDPAADPVLTRFPRPSSTPDRHARRVLELARPRHVTPKEEH